MRIWSLHPRYLDRQGLTACWRESLLAQAVLAGRTLGYRAHPQLDRFREHIDPLGALGWYLHGLADEADGRGFRFNRGLIGGGETTPRSIAVTMGQARFEWDWLRSKLASRSPAVLSEWAHETEPEPHRSFHLIEGPIAPWERMNNR